MHPTFGRYELLKRLAGGGMGEVYLARQRGLDGFSKLLVIKTLLPHLCEDEEFITMFKDEARLTGQLIHPNVCQVFEFDQVDGTYYIAMEYLRGDDLRHLWKACESKARPLRVPLICRIIADAAAGLDFAHSLRDHSGDPYNIVHRDISPQNILVTFEGGVKVIDFGVAKAAGRAQHTRTGALKGKYSYMSPEQVAGKEIDGRTDIFALGIVLHELLTGRRLFKADSDVQTLERVRQTIVPPPSSLNPQIPQSLDGIVLHALAKDPANRFQTAQEFRLAIEDWLIHGRMSASSAHLAEFLKVVYAERLEKEARFGPLLGDAGLTAPIEQMQGRPPSSSGSGNSPMRAGAPPPMGTGGGTVNQRTSDDSGQGQARSDGRSQGRSQIDLSQLETESGASPFAPKTNKQLPIAIVVAVAAVVIAALFLFKGGRPAPAPVAAIATNAVGARLSLRSEPPGAAITLDGRSYGRTPVEGLPLPVGPVRLELALEGYQPIGQQLQLAAGAQVRDFVLEKSAQQKITLLLKSEPAGAEVIEGAIVVGQTPHMWVTEKGDHQLTFTLAGYREVTQPVPASHDGQEVTVRLKKVERAGRATPQQATPQQQDLGEIRTER
jgi:serine/threonine-protein kinase